MNRKCGSPGTCPLERENCPLLEEVRRLREECSRLRERSQTDDLTGLFNLGFLRNALEGEMERTRRTGLPTGFIMADLDHFKRVNDTFGHEEGNKALKWFGKVLRATLRRIDIPCRYGGEEFAVVLPGTLLTEAVRTAERLRVALTKSDLDLGGRPVRITASFGVDAYEGKAELSAGAFIARTDRFLLEAKAKGRDRICSRGLPEGRRHAGLTKEERDALLSQPEK